MKKNIFKMNFMDAGKMFAGFFGFAYLYSAYYYFYYYFRSNRKMTDPAV